MEISQFGKQEIKKQITSVIPEFSCKKCCKVTKEENLSREMLHNKEGEEKGGNWSASAERLKQPLPDAGQCED